MAQIPTLETTAGIGRWLELHFWKELLLTITRVGAELWVGCLFVASAAALIAYFASRWGVSTYRERRLRRLAAQGRLPRKRRRPPNKLSAARTGGKSVSGENTRAKTLSSGRTGSKKVSARGASA